jgi:hypothetical protein
MATTRNCHRRVPRMPSQAVDVVIAVFRQPSTFLAPKQGMLPKDMLDIIKAASGDETTLQKLSEQKHVSAEQMKQASQFYLQKLLTTAGDDKHRKLCLDYGATPSQIKDHKRWLLKWLHPDRNPSKWESQLFVEVSKAAVMLENAEVAVPPPSTIVQRERRSRRKSWKHAERRRPIFSLASFIKSAIMPFAIMVILTCVLIAAIGRYVDEGSAQAQMFGFLKW